jgi:hypothetical protein
MTPETYHDSSWSMMILGYVPNHATIPYLNSSQRQLPKHGMNLVRLPFAPLGRPIFAA